MKRLSSLTNKIGVLAILGILAGVLGGLAIGVVTGHTPSPTSSAGK